MLSRGVRTFALLPAFSLRVGEHLAAQDWVPHHLNFLGLHDRVLAFSKHSREGVGRLLISPGDEDGLLKQAGAALGVVAGGRRSVRGGGI